MRCSGGGGRCAGRRRRRRPCRRPAGGGRGDVDHAPPPAPRPPQVPPPPPPPRARAAEVALGDLQVSLACEAAAAASRRGRERALGLGQVLRARGRRICVVASSWQSFCQTGPFSRRQPIRRANAVWRERLARSSPHAVKGGGVNDGRRTPPRRDQTSAAAPSTLSAQSTKSPWIVERAFDRAVRVAHRARGGDGGGGRRCHRGGAARAAARPPRPRWEGGARRRAHGREHGRAGAGRPRLAHPGGDGAVHRPERRIPRQVRVPVHPRRARRDEARHPRRLRRAARQRARRRARRVHRASAQDRGCGCASSSRTRPPASLTCHVLDTARAAAPPRRWRALRRQARTRGGRRPG